MTRSRDVANIDGILTATGDTFYASAAATPARLGVGSTGDVLTVAGGVPTWATPAGGGFTTASSYTATVENTSSSTYTTLPTANSVTLTTGTKALVLISARATNGGASNQGMTVSFAISGATTRAASDDYCTGYQYVGIANPFNAYTSGAFLVTGLTAGSNTFAQRYKSQQGGGPVYFAERTISVIDLGS